MSTSSEAWAIDARGLTKRFGTVTAVRGVTLQVPNGTIFAFLGPNGSGKSTTVRLLTGLLAPTAGEARVRGRLVSVEDLELRREIGILPEDDALFPDLTIWEHLELCGRLYGFGRQETDARALAKATPGELEPVILSTGFFRQKSKALIGMAQGLVAEHEGNVPADMERLTKLPGVGRKTANVVLGHALGVPGLPVDRHVLRVSNRIGIAEGDDPVKVEEQLCAELPKEMWTLASDVQILHGRRVCKPKPLCDQCSVRDDCDYFRVVVSRGPGKVRAAKGKVRRGGASGPPERRDKRKIRTTRR